MHITTMQPPTKTLAELRAEVRTLDARLADYTALAQATADKLIEARVELALAEEMHRARRSVTIAGRSFADNHVLEWCANPT